VQEAGDARIAAGLSGESSCQGDQDTSQDG
jgi:hypothetical protein